MIPNVILRDFVSEYHDVFVNLIVGKRLIFTFVLNADIDAVSIKKATKFHVSETLTSYFVFCMFIV